MRIDVKESHGQGNLFLNTGSAAASFMRISKQGKEALVSREDDAGITAQCPERLN